jgi:hypothetical protein
MRFINKKFMLFMTNVFLLAGIGSTIANYSTSFIQGEAIGSTNVVIAELYGGGGNSSAPYKKDYVVLFNLSSLPVDLSTWSIQYVSATGPGAPPTNPWSKVDLTGTIQPYRFFLVGISPEGINGVSLTSPDVNSTTISAAATAGKIALLSSQTLTGNVKKPTSNLVDFIGYGTTADEREGTTTTDNTPAPSNTLAIKRKNVFFDTDNNKSDFETSAPTPLNSSSKSTTAEIFANYFLSQTETKSGSCTDAGLGWSTTLTSDYNNLSAGQKALFVGGSANTAISNAVSRYLYLRSFDATLTNFANL